LTWRKCQQPSKSANAAARSVQRLHVEAARRLLVTTTLPVKRVAQRCGFGSEETLRRTLLRHANTTPRDCRARFSAAAEPR
jgi:transcriptional regulator GlxA family with amidase domain